MMTIVMYSFYVYVFCQTVLCGKWHPAAVTSFSSHWNAAGIARLRSAVEGATKSIEKDLVFRVLPLAQNVCLKCLRLRRAIQDLLVCSQQRQRDDDRSDHDDSDEALISCIDKLVCEAKGLLLKVIELSMGRRA